MTDEVLAILDEVRGTEPTPEDVRAAADRIAGVGEAAVPPLLEALAEEDEAVLTVAAASLRRLASPALVQRLLVLLRSSRIDDLAKALVLGVLEDAGMDIHDASLVGSVVDVDGILREAARRGAAVRPPGGNGGHSPPARGDAE